MTDVADRPSTEHLLVQVLLRSAEELLEVLGRDPVDAESRSHAESVLGLSFAPVWSRLQLLEVRVADEAIEWEGNVVLDALEGSLVATLRSAAIRSLTLVPGVERGEMQLFLAAVDRARTRAGRPAADLVTLLFRADFQHLRYAVGEPLPSVPPSAGSGAFPPPPAGPVPGAPTELRDALRRDVAGEPRRGLARPEKFDSTLYFLDKKEIEYLKSSIDEEYARSPARGATSLLFETLEARPEPEVRDEVLDTLNGLLPHLLGSGEFDGVSHLISEARRVVQTADLDPRQEAALHRIRASVSEPAALEQLFHALDGGGVRTSADAIWTLMRELRPEAIRSLLAWPQQMANREASAVVSEAIDCFFQEWPLALERMLGGADRAVVHSALDVAARVKHPEFADLVARAASDPDPSTRARVVNALTAIGTTRSFRLLSQMATDADGGVRTSVFAAFAARPYRSALPMLETALSAPDLEERGEREKRALFEAYGASAGTEGTELLESLLRGKSRGGRKPSPHTRACAALALGRIEAPRARTALSEAARDRDPLVRNAVNTALRGGT